MSGKGIKLQGVGLVPVGSIVAYNPGFYTNSSNGSFTISGPAGNTVAQINAFLNAQGWYVCDGAAVNDSKSPIWNAAGRNLPNLNDSRFLFGSSSAGTVGGAATVTLDVNNLPLHNHGVGTLANSSSSISGTANSGVNLAHSHSASTDTTGAHIHSPFNVRANATGFGTGGLARSNGVGTVNDVAGDMANVGNHSHIVTVNNSGSLDHSHSVSGTAAAQTISGSTANTGSGTAFSILPTYLSTFYIVRVF